MSLQLKFAATRNELASALIERDQEIDLVLTGLLAGEHVLLVGPPGCAKSLLLDSLMSWMNCNKFSILLNKFSTPEEVFGPISIEGLRKDEYRRVTTGKLPEASLFLADEIFKASTAILNTLLKILNEKTFEDKRCPLKLAVAASNEWPNNESGKELGALFDRFLLRKSVVPIRSPKSRSRLLWTESHLPKLSTTLSVDELATARSMVSGLAFSSDAQKALEEIIAECLKEGIVCSDRRQYKSVGILRAYAWLMGADSVGVEHMEVLQHVLWDDPQEQPKVVAQVVAKVANPIGMRLNGFLSEIDSVLESVDLKRMDTVVQANAKLKLIYDELVSITDTSGRVGKVAAYVKEQGKQLKLNAMKAIG